MKKRLFLMGSVLAMAILILASITLVAHFTARPAEADNTTYLIVYHRNIYGTDVATSGTAGITVTVRQWPGGTTWYDVTNTVESWYTCNEGTRAWRYNTSLSGTVEFKVNVKGGKTGTKCGGGATSYVDDDELNELVSQGGTGSITAGWYYP